MKIVLDTNVFWVSISRKSSTHWVFEKLLSGAFQLCVTTDILEEYEEIIGQRLGQDVASYVLEVIDSLPHLVYITRYYHWNLIINDPDDDKFVDCAVAANADFIVTNDKHFDILKNVAFPKVLVINQEEFKELWSIDD
ncbi:MAG: putative toxin-antitoxin system toxin component, PIN family [Spirosomataceae bacterium]